MNVKLSYVPNAVQACRYLLCKTYKYVCTCSVFKLQSPGLTSGLTDASCETWNLIPGL